MAAKVMDAVSTDEDKSSPPPEQREAPAAEGRPGGRRRVQWEGPLDFGVLISAVRALAVLAPVAAGALYGFDRVALEYQKSLCPELGSAYDGGFVFPFIPFVILVPPWLFLAAWQTSRFGRKLRIVDVFSPLLIGISAWSLTASVKWFFIPELSGPRCDFAFWRDYGAGGDILLPVTLAGWACAAYLLFALVAGPKRRKPSAPGAALTEGAPTPEGPPRHLAD